VKPLSDKTRARLRSAAWWVGALALVLVVRAWQTREAASGAAPSLRAESLSGAPVDLRALRGGAVVVHFWATWCTVCAAERGNVESLASGGRVITVASASGSRGEVARYVREQGFTAPVVVDERGALARAYGVTAYPTTFYVDPDGIIRHVEVGYTTTLGMRARLALAGLRL
jgi:peroxiredoxin